MEEREKWHNNVQNNEVVASMCAPSAGKGISKGVGSLGDVAVGDDEAADERDDTMTKAAIDIVPKTKNRSAYEHAESCRYANPSHEFDKDHLRNDCLYCRDDKDRRKEQPWFWTVQDLGCSVRPQSFAAER